MTERGRGDLDRDARVLAMGPSGLRWSGDRLEIAIDERAAPLPHRVKGRILVHPQALTGRDFVLDPGPGRHRWWPIAPRARVELEMEKPSLSWRGHGYLDMNAGGEPLERGFLGWDWSRADLGAETAIVYDRMPLGGQTQALALRIDTQGSIEGLPVPPRATLPPTALWRIPRRGHSETGARVARTLEDTPFYARSLLELTINGRRAIAVHESLSLRRFAAPWVQAMLPFRMPRLARSTLGPSKSGT
jgi:carotenoid 1,2-hydratase